MGLFARAVRREMVSRWPSCSISMEPCMGLPDQGAYRFLSAKAPRERAGKP